MVTWTDESEVGVDTSQAAVRGQIFDAPGYPAGSEFLVDTTTTGNQFASSAAGLEGGGFVVTWADRSLGVETGGDDPSGAAIRGQIFDAAGDPVGDEFLVNTNNPG